MQTEEQVDAATPDGVAEETEVANLVAEMEAAEAGVFRDGEASDTDPEPAEEPSETEPEDPAANEPKEEPKQDPNPEPTGEEVEGEPKDSATDRSWEAIKREDKRLQSQRDEIKAQLDQLSQQQAQLQDAQRRLDEESRLWRDDPIKALESKGIKFEELAQRVLNNNQAPPSQAVKQTESRLQGELEKLREEQTQTRQLLQQMQQERMINDYSAEVRGALSDEKYEILGAYSNAEQMVLDTARSYAAEYGRALSPVEAATMTLERVQGQLQQLGSNRAVRSLLGISDDAAPKQDTGGQSESPQRKPEPQKTGAPKTLTNRLAAAPSQPSEDEDLGDLSEAEDIQRALRLVE